MIAAPGQQPGGKAFVMHSFVHRLPGLSLVLVLAAVGCDQKPTAADAKAPEKSVAPPVAAKTEKPADPKVKVVEGANPTEDRYALEVVPPPEGKVGQEGTVMVKVVPKSPWHMNLDFPTSLAVAAPDGVKLAKAEQNKADAIKLDDNSAEFGVKFTPSAAGDQSFTGKFKFAVCQDEACSPVTEELAFRVAVK